MDIKEVFLTWGNSLGSQNTWKRYHSSVELYCEMVFGKKPAELTEQDLKGLLYSDTINKFVKPLRDRGIKDTTIKGHLIAMRSYVKMIRREKIFSGIDFNLLMIDALVLDHVSVRDTQHHEAMSLEELQNGCVISLINRLRRI